MKKQLFVLAMFYIISVFLSQKNYAQNLYTPESNQPVYNSELSKNALNISPVSLLLGDVSANYEHLFTRNHGIFAEGSYSFGKGSGYALGYRYHFGDKDSNSIFSSYLGIFIRSQKTKTNVKDDDKKESYDFNMKSLNIGVHYGNRYSWGGPFNFSWRIGYGFPVTSEFSWSPKKHHDYKSIESLTRVVSGIDAELSFGIVF